ncbi:MAG: transcription antitermination factor NusB [Firmicutes bacterium]|nr:transcription antitermination factor NusB [Bacillota bacterium]
MARHHARELALRVLFEHDLASTSVQDVLDRTLKGASPEDGKYARMLVEGTLAEQPAIDQWIRGVARGWRLERMPPIDRNILRLACYEMMCEPNLPISVIIDEALELAQDYSTDEAKRFVNGVLGTIAQKLRPDGDRDQPR